MTKSTLLRGLRILRGTRGKSVIAVSGALLLASSVLSCRTVSRSVVVLPNVPGATYVGSRECETCHEELYRGFATADHARLVAEGTNALQAGCESCHGPASAHVESGGEVKPPYAFSAGRPRSSSFPALADETAREVENVCFTCHGNVRGEFNLPNHHPVPEGQMSCTECHPPHHGPAHVGGGTAILSQNESCLRCHDAQRGPFVFEHEAMREGCNTCHASHGAVNEKLLKVRDSNLCLRCHFQRASNGRLLIGGSDHTLRVQQGTCWTAGCHEAVHGSRVSSSLRF